MELIVNRQYLTVDSISKSIAVKLSIDLAQTKEEINKELTYIVASEITFKVTSYKVIHGFPQGIELAFIVDDVGFFVDYCDSNYNNIAHPISRIKHWYNGKEFYDGEDIFV